MHLKSAIIIIMLFTLCKSSSISAQKISKNLGIKSYEVSNHLGNVMVVVSDRKTPTPETTNKTIAFFETDIKAFNDYYPYGMLLDNRNKATDYRFGFQGQEKDDEVKGKSNNINYKYRVHDSRLGRFFAVDPLLVKYPFNSSYAFSENNVIHAVELEGLEKVLLKDLKRGINLIYNISDLKEDQIKTLVLSHGFNWDSDWMDYNADDEIWELTNTYTYWGYSTGTRVEKFLTNNAYENNGIPYLTEYDRWLNEWFNAYDESLDDVNNGMQLSLAIVTSFAGGIGFAIGKMTVTSIVIFAANGAMTIDDMSNIDGSDGRTMFESLGHLINEDYGEGGAKILKFSFSLVNAYKGALDVSATLLSGDKINATFDVVNKTWSNYNLITSGVRLDELMKDTKPENNCGSEDNCNN